MTTPLSVNENLIHPIDVLGKTLTQIGGSYQTLLTQPESEDYCFEAGRTLRHVSDRYAQVLVAALSNPPDTDGDPEARGEEESPEEEFWDDE